MTYENGKAISGGAPLSQDEIDGLARQQLDALRKAFGGRYQGTKSDNLLDQRLAEEMRLVQRMLEMVENAMRQRQQYDAANAIERAEDAIEDIADVVEAGDRCAAIGTIDPAIARRLNRAGLDDNGKPCASKKRLLQREAG